MALQARLMQELIHQEGIRADFLASNLSFPRPLAILERLRGVRPFLRSAVFCCELWKNLRRVEIVHILACSWLYFFLVVCPAVLISRVRRRRVILNYRGGEADHFLRWFGFVVKPFFRMADVVIAPSQFLVEVIGRRIGLPVKVVPNIVNFDRFRYRERETLRPRMVVTRHLLKLYGIESVILAFGEVQKRYPEASLMIVGTGDQETYLKKITSEMTLQNVAFLGYVAQQDLPAVYDKCDILLNASRADNFPGSLVEAAAAGLLVISTGVGGIPFIFEHEKSALLVKPGDWRGLAAEVLRVIEDPLLAKRLRNEAVHQVRKYEWPNVRRLLYRVYGWEDGLLGTRDHKSSFEIIVGGAQSE
jgi:glycosyltransferase involved in cell wall biosynthesis